jgi:sodium/bile acid cotransporter 7
MGASLWSGVGGFLRQRWFLLLLLAGVTLAGLRPEWLRPATRWVEPRIIVAPALFLMAWSLESRSLFRALLQPWAALWALVISYGALPALAWLTGSLLPDADLSLGLLISASVPCTLASAVLWTRMAGGCEATALLVIFLSTATSWLATTAWLTFATGANVHVDTSDMMVSLLLVLVLPVGLGQLSRAIGPLARAATQYKHGLGVVSQVLILCIILRTAVDVMDRLAQRLTVAWGAGLLVTAGMCVGTHLLALGAGLWSSKGLGFDRPRQIAVAFACSQKTLPVALFLFEGYFKESHPLAVVPLLFYHVGQLVVDTFIADALAGPRPAAV